MNNDLELIDAEYALEKSLNCKTINDLKRSIIISINNAVEKGLFRCLVSILVDTKQFVRDELQKWLSEKNYISIMPGYGTNLSNIEVYYDNIEIIWEGRKK